MYSFFLEERNNNEITDLKNNIERLRKIRSLNIKNTNQKENIKFKVLSKRENPFDFHT